MEQNLFENKVFMRYALDAVPAIVLVTDEDVRVLFRNQAARDLISSDKFYGDRAGNQMHCVHSTDSPEGCGRGPACGDCLLRASVNAAFAGEPVRRRRVDMTLNQSGKTVAIPALVSATPFHLDEKMYALLVIEDISELIELRSLLPICGSCKKIRSDDGSWEKVETYLRRHAPEVSLSHGLCPDCAKKLYPDHSD